MHCSATRVLSFAVVMATASFVALGTLGAQGRVPPPPPTPRIAVTLQTPPAPAPHGGMHPGNVIGHGGYVSQFGLRNAGGRWIAPYTVVEGAATPVPVPYPVAVPVPYAAPVWRAESPKPPPVPYDPKKASLRVIGGGADGGGGVMRLTRIGADSLRMVWLGDSRPTDEARLFVADSTYQELRALTVSDGRREARFRINGHSLGIAYAGVAITHSDGSRKTVLVPLSEIR